MINAARARSFRARRLAHPVHVRAPTLSIVCEACARRGRYAVARLMEQYSDAKLTDLLQTLANCPKARSASIHDRCKAVFEGLAV
ncbi:MAG TPA: hypothetical protein VFE60_12485 [Roseiarcus sp.]|nr:hypothetical protein [Roseiarcus sp.]